MGSSGSEDMKRIWEGKENFSSCYFLSNALSNTLFLYFFLDVYVLNILHVKRRETFPKRNKGRDDTRDEKKSQLPSDNEGEEDVEEPPKVNLYISNLCVDRAVLKSHLQVKAVLAGCQFLECYTVRHEKLVNKNQITTVTLQIRIVTFTSPPTRQHSSFAETKSVTTVIGQCRLSLFRPENDVLKSILQSSSSY